MENCNDLSILSRLMAYFGMLLVTIIKIGIKKVGYIMNDFNTKWNWGAFVNPFWFAIANRSWLLFLNLIPLFNIFWLFYGAVNAEKWALKNETNEYRDEIEFRKVMDGWNRAGLIMFIASIILSILYFGFISMMMASILHGVEPVSHVNHM